MKISYLLGYTLSAIWWLIVVCFQLLIPLTIVLGFTEGTGFLGCAALLAVVTAPLTAWCGGLNTVPSIVWRFRKNLQTRIIELEGSYALQIKVFGSWLYVDASEGELGNVMTGRFDGLSAYPFILDKRSKAEKYLLRLQEDIAQGCTTTQCPPEVIATQTITRGNIVKVK